MFVVKSNDKKVIKAMEEIKSFAVAQGKDGYLTEDKEIDKDINNAKLFKTSEEALKFAESAYVPEHLEKAEFDKNIKEGTISIKEIITRFSPRLKFM